jgi:predicted MFS family arabinose efflux permease
MQLMNIISNKKIKQNHLPISTILAFALIPLSGFATDIYLPSMPTMGSTLQISSMEVQMTLTIFLISYGFAQLFIGSLLDSFGRYYISQAALVFFTLSCIVIANTSDIYIIYLMRIIHGITVAGIVVAKRAYFVDVFEGLQLKAYLSLFTIIWSTGPIIAPFVGGYLQNLFGWQSNFYFLAGFAAILYVFEMIFSGETVKNLTEFKLKKIVFIYWEMIGTVDFLLGLCMLGLAYSMVMIYNLAGPFIIEHQLLMTPIVAGYCSLVLGLAWTVGGLIGKATVDKPFFKKLVVNIGLQLICVLAMILSLNILVNMYTLVFFAFIIHIGAGFTYNNYFTYSLSKFPKNAGIAGGLMGGVVYILVSLLSYVIICIFPAKDERNLSFGYLILVLISVGAMTLLYKHKARSKTNRLTATL